MDNKPEPVQVSMHAQVKLIPSKRLDVGWKGQLQDNARAARQTPATTASQPRHGPSVNNLGTTTSMVRTNLPQSGRARSGTPLRGPAGGPTAAGHQHLGPLRACTGSSAPASRRRPITSAPAPTGPARPVHSSCGPAATTTRRRPSTHRKRPRPRIAVSPSGEGRGRRPLGETSPEGTRHGGPLTSGAPGCRGRARGSSHPPPAEIAVKTGDAARPCAAFEVGVPDPPHGGPRGRRRPALRR